MKKSFRQILKFREAKLACEKTDIRIKDAPFSVCLIFPNTYRVGMSNLAMHTLYALGNSRKDFRCERSFGEDPLTGYSLETGASIADFDVIAFSVSFELDYPRIIKILQSGRIPPRSADRTNSHPLVIAGGPCVFSNPEPIADFVDAFAVGEGEELFHDVLDVVSEHRRQGGDKKSLLRALAGIPGVYIPSFYEPQYCADGSLEGMNWLEGPCLPIAARFVDELDRHPCSSVVLTRYTEFADMFLVELGRGCRRGCKFCSACYTYYRRNRSVERIIEQIEPALEVTQRVGLVTSDFSDYPQRNELLSFLVKKNVMFSVSSIRADAITDDILLGISRGRQRTLTLAPEVASEKLKAVTGKRISSETLLELVARALDRGIIHFKLYFIIGFPDEEDEDVAAIVQLASQVQALMLSNAGRTGKIGKLTVSVNPFIPKPFTPMESEQFADEALLSKRIHILRAGLGRIGNTSLIVESPRMAKLQCAFARGDRRASSLVAAAGESAAQAMREFDRLIQQYVERQPMAKGSRPWHVVEPPSAGKRKKEGFN